MHTGRGIVGPIKRAAINVASSGDNTVVAAVTGTKIVVTHYFIMPASAVTVTWKSGSTEITGNIQLAANGGGNDSSPDEGLFETAEGEALILNLGGAVAVDGYLVYHLV